MKKAFVTTGIALLVCLGISACGQDVVETTEEITIEENTTEAVTTESILVTALEWETPYIELAATETSFSDDPRDYIFTEDESQYDLFTVENNIDVMNPGEYEIIVSSAEQSFSFPVVVQDTAYPEMEVAADYILGREGERLKATDLITKAADNDAEYRIGLMGFEYVSNFEGFDFYHIETTVPVYEQTVWNYDAELLSEIVIPAEEGVYTSTAMVVDRTGNATISKMYFLVDNTAPEIHIPTDHIKLKLGQDFDFADGVSCTDNLYPADYCSLWIEDADLSALFAFLGQQTPGSWKFSYSTEDPLGNFARKEVKVTLEGKSSGGGSSQTVQSGFDLAMAQEAFAKINEYRRNAGLNELSWNDTLYEAAKIRAQEQVAVYGHTRPDGSHCDTVKAQVGWNGTTGENAAKGTLPFSGLEVAELWYNSDGHRQNILIPQYNYGAIACYVQDGWAYWINIFSN